MAELLVRVKDRFSDDFEKNVLLSKRGDVIVVCEDGWPWGTEEVNNPDWRIIRVNMTVEEAQKYLKKQDDGKADDDPTKLRFLMRHGINLDLDHPNIPEDVKAQILDDKREEPIIEAIHLDVKKIEKVKPLLLGLEQGKG